MNCNVCGKTEASIHLTEIVNNNMAEVHLCERCAQEKGSELGHQFSFSDLLAGLADFSPLMLSQAEAGQKCSSCGKSVADLGKSGRLGCPDCYKDLQKALLPLIKRVQRATQHVGKKPAAMAPKMKRQFALRDLQDKLRKYIQDEKYEEAAAVRDEIKKLEMGKLRAQDKKPESGGSEKSSKERTKDGIE